MKIKVLNNRRVQRAFSNGLWVRIGKDFPSDRTYYIVGLFGIIIYYLK